MGHGPPPAEDRRRSNAPARGDWVAVPGSGWQHGRVPAPPPKVLKATRDVWAAWFGAWFAAHWQPEDLAGLYIVGKLYDAVLRGELQRSAELRIQMDAYGMTPKGQQDRRWKRPAPDLPAGDETGKSPGQKGGHYGHLRTVDGGKS